MSTAPNRHQRRIEAAKARRRGEAAEADAITAAAVNVFSSIAAADPTVTGATLITPSGEVRFLDAAVFRRGGRA